MAEIKYAEVLEEFPDFQLYMEQSQGKSLLLKVVKGDKSAARQIKYKEAKQMQPWQIKDALRDLCITIQNNN